MLIQQHEMALQQLEATKLSSEASQRQHMDALRKLAENGTSIEPSQAPPHKVQEWTFRKLFTTPQNYFQQEDESEQG